MAQGTLVDYTIKGEIVRGSQWPAYGTNVLTVTLTDTAGWAVGAEDWDWSMLFSRAVSGSTPDLTITALTVTRDDPNTALILTFRATPTETLKLPAGVPIVNVDIQAFNDPTIYIDDRLQGTAHIRAIAGQSA